MAHSPLPASDKSVDCGNLTADQFVQLCKAWVDRTLPTAGYFTRMADDGKVSFHGRRKMWRERAVWFFDGFVSALSK